MAEDDKVGWEIDGEFVPVAFNADHGKDLMLLDRIAAMDLGEFLDALSSGSGRPTTMLTMLATSIRAKHPDWSVDRIYRMVTTDLSDLQFVGGEAPDALPPPDAPEPGQTDAPTTSSSDGSSLSSTPTAPVTEPRPSARSSKTPA